jgi:hypothetical protein
MPDEGTWTHGKVRANLQTVGLAMPSMYPGLSYRSLRVALELHQDLLKEMGGGGGGRGVNI